MAKQKRMVYIYEENLEFYDNLINKSEFINEAIRQNKTKKEVTNPNIEYIRERVANMDARHAGTPASPTT